MIRTIRRHVVLFVGVSALACNACTGRRSVDRSIDLDSAAGIAVFRAAEEFWAAAADRDSSRMLALSGDAAVVDWARRWQHAYPGFFVATAEHLAVQDFYFVHRGPDTALVQFEVPWVTCRPPAHDGLPDRYFAMFVEVERAWTLVKVWRNIC